MKTRLPTPATPVTATVSRHSAAVASPDGPVSSPSRDLGAQKQRRAHRLSQSSPLTYPSGAYAVSLAADPATDGDVGLPPSRQTTIGGGTRTRPPTRTVGRLHASMVDPSLTLTLDENGSRYAAPPRRPRRGHRSPWATWWGLINWFPAADTTGTDLSEFRLRAP